MMSNGPFIWHPDQNDVYEGDVYGRTTLTGSFSSFNKLSGNSFTMTGDDDAVLKLLPIGVRNPKAGENITIWGLQSHNDNQLTQINIKGGTFIYQTNPHDPSRVARQNRKPKPNYGLLYLGNIDPNLSLLEFNIDGNLIIQDTDILTQPSSDGFPVTTFNVNPGGTCRITGEYQYSGSFKINVNDQASMSMAASAVQLGDGSCIVDGAPPDEKTPSLQITALPLTSAPNPPPVSDLGPGDLYFPRQEISCKSASVSRLHAVRLITNSARIKAEDTASIIIACDKTEIDTPIGGGTGTGTVFSVSYGNASITFNGMSTGLSPFDFWTTYPAGLLNFITNESSTINKSKFRFRLEGSSFLFSRMLSDGIITVNGQRDTTYQTMWEREVDSKTGESYFTILLDPNK